MNSRPADADLFAHRTRTTATGWDGWDAPAYDIDDDLEGEPELGLTDTGASGISAA